MARLSGAFSVLSPLTPLPSLAHPLQVLVIDRLNGPADVLFDAVRLLMGAAVEVTLVEDHDDALRALDASRARSRSNGQKCESIQWAPLTGCARCRWV